MTSLIATTMPEERLDISDCDKELVHIPGAIQPHGALLAVDPFGLRIVAVSSNVGVLLGRAADQLLGRSIASIACAEEGDLLVRALGREHAEEHNPFTITMPNGGRFQVVAHRHDGRIIVECEPEDREPEFAPSSAYNRVRGSLVRLRSSANLRDLCEGTAREVRRLTGFDRVLIYKFKSDWSGEVVAEDCVDGPARYEGLRFPASDIPTQARALYASCRLRLVPTSKYTPARLVGLEDGRPIDLTHATLRSISPVHLEYMSNMGVTASLGISLMYEDRLWGLITCNHESGPRFIPYEARVACSLVGEVVSSLIGQKQGVDVAGERASFLDTQAKITQFIVQEHDIVRGLTEHTPSILDVTHSPGAALLYNDRLYCIGRTPPSAEVEKLLSWIEQQKAETLIFDSLPERYTPAVAWKNVGCGLMATSISFSDSSVVSKKNWLVWFRPEVIQTVSWGGDPNKPTAKGSSDRLHPRTSFERWKEDVQLKAIPFQSAEIAAAKSLAVALVDVILEIEASRLVKRQSLLLDASNRELVQQIEENERVGRALAARTEQLRQRESSLQLVLDATGEGLISVGLDGRLLVERSRAVEQWFAGASDGAFIWDVLFQGNDDTRLAFQAMWQQLAADLLPFDVCVDQLPAEFSRDGRSFQIGYKEVRDSDTLCGILVAIEDVTERLEARRAARDAAEAQVILALVLRDARGFGRTLSEFARLALAARDAASSSDARRALHTLKGNAAVLGLATLQEKCHELEDQVAEACASGSACVADTRAVDEEIARVVERVRDLAGGDAFERVEVPIGDLNLAIERIERGGDSDQVLALLRRWTLEPVERQLNKMAARARRLARALGKEVEVRVSGGDVRVDADSFERLWGGLSHAVSNAVDHGLETASARLARGKSAHGCISLSAKESGDGTITIEIADDGAGVDLDALRQVARRRGLPCATRQELLDALFADELSTRTEVSSTSGRGVGMAALRAVCDELGGSVHVETAEGAGTTVRVRIRPLVRERAAGTSRTSG
ncbi:MAG: GAF domain-containing protein [Polyangiaceae bacterium]|jgi:light-regulated signal transduction histidine kinase (bacteriophytochrome)/HPt (histidine-containing phosphotransfer) domain-containing protein